MPAPEGPLCLRVLSQAQCLHLHLQDFLAVCGPPLCPWRSLPSFSLQEAVEGVGDVFPEQWLISQEGVGTQVILQLSQPQPAVGTIAKALGFVLHECPPPFPSLTSHVALPCPRLSGILGYPPVFAKPNT